MSMNNERRDSYFAISFVIARVKNDIIHRTIKSGSFNIATAKATKSLYKISHYLNSWFIFGEFIERTVGFGIDLIWKLGKFFSHQNGW